MAAGAHTKSIKGDNIVEAYLLAKIRARRHTLNTKGADKGETGTWRSIAKGTPLWTAGLVKGDDGTWYEMKSAPFARDLAALGIAHWEDVTHKDGGMLPYKHLVVKWGLKNGKEVDERVRKLYHNVKAHANELRYTGVWRAWTQQRARQMSGEEEQYQEHIVAENTYETVQAVKAWRKAPSLAVEGTDVNPMYHSVEYLIKWRGGVLTWEHGAHLMRACTSALRMRLVKVRATNRLERHTAWYDERKQRGIQVNTKKPGEREVKLFKKKGRSLSQS